MRTSSESSREKEVWWIEARRRRGDYGVSQLLLTVLVPPALRKDTQWLPWQLHLALLILQFSAQERKGREGWKEAGKERVKRERGFHFPCRSKHTEGMSHLTETFTHTSTSTDFFVSVYVNTTTHTHTRCLFSFPFFCLGNGLEDGSLLSTHIIHCTWM